MIKKLISLPRNFKIFLIILNDLIITIFSFHLAYYIRLENIFFLNLEQYLPIILSIIIFLPMFLISGLYNNINRYNNLNYISKLLQLILFYSFLLFLIISVTKIDSIPRSITIIQPILFFLFIVFSRVLLIFLINNHNLISTDENSLVIFKNINDINKFVNFNNVYGSLIKCFVDLDRNNLNQKINNIKIYHPDKIEFLVKNFKIKTIFIIKDLLSPEQKKNIFFQLNKFNVRVKFLELNKNQNLENNKLDLNIILQRKIKFNFEILKKETYNKTILVTGGGGTIGSELCHQIIKYKPKELIILDHSEYNLYKINLKIKNLIKKNSYKVNILPILGSITDKEFVREIFEKYKPKKVYHSAAYKHVGIVENNVITSIKNNFFGTLNLVEHALKNSCEKFILISTDKAVNPINAMGATKRLAEMVIESISTKKNKTIFCAVRFGNVLDSSGSVIPLFRQQIIEGGPLTVTHPEVKRYFMLVSEAVSLVLSADQMSTGGEIFTLDMGEQYKILDLAKLMIKSYGMSEKNDTNPEGDIGIKIIGLNKKEKLMEQLNYSDKKLQKTSNENIYKTITKNINYEEFDKLKNKILFNLENKNETKLFDIFENYIEGFEKK